MSLLLIPVLLSISSKVFCSSTAFSGILVWLSKNIFSPLEIEFLNWLKSSIVIGSIPAAKPKETNASSQFFLLTLLDKILYAIVDAFNCIPIWSYIFLDSFFANSSKSFLLLSLGFWILEINKLSNELAFFLPSLLWRVG